MGVSCSHPLESSNSHYVSYKSSDGISLHAWRGRDATLIDLPPATLELIFSDLTMDELINVRRSCVRNRDIVDSGYLLEKRFLEKYKPSERKLLLNKYNNWYYSDVLRPLICSDTKFGCFLNKMDSLDVEEENLYSKIFIFNFICTLYCNDFFCFVPVRISKLDIIADKIVLGSQGQHLMALRSPKTMELRRVDRMIESDEVNTVQCQSIIGTVTFSPNERVMIVQYENYTADIWMFFSENEIGSQWQKRGEIRHKDKIINVAFNEACDIIVTTSEDQTIQFFKSLGQEVWEFKRQVFYTGYHLETTLSKNGQYIAVTLRKPEKKHSKSTDVLAIDSGNGFLISKEATISYKRSLFKGYRPHVYGTIFSPDSRMLIAVTSVHGTVIWKLDRGNQSEEVLSVRCGLLQRHSFNMLRFSEFQPFSPDGQYVVCLSAAKAREAMISKITAERELEDQARIQFSKNRLDSSVRQTTVKFSPKSQQMACIQITDNCDANEGAQIWGMNIMGRWELAHIFSACHASVLYSDGNYFSYSSDSQYLVFNAGHRSVALVRFYNELNVECNTINMVVSPQPGVEASQQYQAFDAG